MSNNYHPNEVYNYVFKDSYVLKESSELTASWMDRRKECLLLPVLVFHLSTGMIRIILRNEKERKDSSSAGHLNGECNYNEDRVKTSVFFHSSKSFKVLILHYLNNFVY